MSAYGQITQYEKGSVKTPPLDDKGIKYKQTKFRLLFYYSRAVDPTMLPALNVIHSSQSKPTLCTKLAADILLRHDHTHPNAKVCYHARDMILHVESYTTYLFVPGVRSCITGKYYLIDHPTDPTNPSDVNPNRPILTECDIV